MVRLDIKDLGYNTSLYTSWWEGCRQVRMKRKAALPYVCTSKCSPGESVAIMQIMGRPLSPKRCWSGPLLNPLVNVGIVLGRMHGMNWLKK